MRVPSTDGVTLELHHLGGEGPPLLVVHATGFCAGPYRHLVPVLGRRFTLWGLDVRSHGDSTDANDGEVSWKGTARDVLAGSLFAPQVLRVLPPLLTLDEVAAAVGEVAP